MNPSLNHKPLVTQLTSLQSTFALTRKKSNFFCMASLLSCGILLSACSFFSTPPQPRGAFIEKEDWQDLKVGSSSKSDAQDLLGSPTTFATFDPNSWIYISMQTRTVPLTYPGVRKQQVLVLNFDQSGVLQQIQELNKKDAKPVRMISSITPTPGSKTNFFQQLLGNIGQYSPLSAMGMGSTFGPSGSSGGPFSNNPIGSGPGSSGNALGN